MEDYNTKITTNDRKAKKEHRCRLCNSIIEVGEVYTLMSQIDGVAYVGCNRYKNFAVCLMHDVANIKIKKNKLYEV